MRLSLSNFRRRSTSSAVRLLDRATRPLSAPALDRLGRALGFAGSIVWPLRRRLRTNLELALGAGNVPPGTVDDYFRRLGIWAGWSLSIHQEKRTPAQLDIACHESLARLEEAASEGRGVILAAPHDFGHEMAAGVIAHVTRPSVVALVRESASKSRQAIKAHWYRSLGLETVTLRRDSSHAREIRDCLAALRQGKILGITPDIVALSRQDGALVSFFGRRVRVKPGATALSVLSGAPVVTGSVSWRHDPLQMVPQFSEPDYFAAPTRRLRADELRQCIDQGTQAWFTRYEAHLRRHPANWMFWLDKRWTEVFRSKPMKAAA